MEKPRDVVGGLLIMAIGGGFVLFGGDLPRGTSFRMGPGYFPTILSWLMVLLGGIMLVTALRQPRDDGSRAGSAVPWRGLFLVVGAVLLFGLTLRGLGLVPALMIVMLGTAWSSRYASLRASLPLAVGLTFFCVLLFVRGLGLPLPLLGHWTDPQYWVHARTEPPAAAAPATP